MRGRIPNWATERFGGREAITRKETASSIHCYAVLVVESQDRQAAGGCTIDGGREDKTETLADIKDHEPLPDGVHRAGLRECRRGQRWWLQGLDCKPVRVASEWDDPLPSDAAPKLPGDDKPTILLGDRAESAPAEGHPSLSCNKIERAHEDLRNRGPAPGPTRKPPARVFEVPDPYGHVFEICKEP